MKYPNRIRIYTKLKKIGNSFFALIPKVMREYLNINSSDEITVTLNRRLRKITIRKLRRR